MLSAPASLTVTTTQLKQATASYATHSQTTPLSPLLLQAAAHQKLVRAAEPRLAACKCCQHQTWRPLMSGPAACRCTAYAGRSGGVAATATATMRWRDCSPGFQSACAAQLQAAARALRHHPDPAVVKLDRDTELNRQTTTTRGHTTLINAHAHTTRSSTQRQDRHACAP